MKGAFVPQRIVMKTEHRTFNVKRPTSNEKQIFDSQTPIPVLENDNCSPPGFQDNPPLSAFEKRPPQP
jgi:hypothetical protein